MIKAADEQGEIDWSYALRSASVLASAQIERAQDAALRIAQTCLSAGAEVNEGHRRAAALILERMGNQLALRLADERDLVEDEAWAKAPVPLAMDVIHRRLELSIPSKTGRALPVNQFQRDFWTAARSASWVSVSAPTSAGKSYIVAAWFKEQIEAQGHFRGVYIVPTRALIDEVSHELKRIFDGAVPIFNIPWDEEIDSVAQEAYVFTQERMHFLQQRLPQFATTMLFIDEAQKFGDGERGVLLQRVVAEAVQRAPKGQVIFASPLSSNPELLLEGMPADAEGTPVRSEVITVNQNLLWVEEAPHEAKTWKVELVREGEPLKLGEVELDARTTSVTKRISLVAVALGRQHKGNLVYANGPSEAERIAKQIGEARRNEVDLSGHEEIVKLKELVEKTIHRRYRLIGALDAGVAFHYGNMPLLVRTKIEELFREGVLSYLVCTSTLMEGVNLPSSNLFAMGPKKGHRTLMEPADFWNLAGRAGRWGKEFQGNIICIDPRDTKRWNEPPLQRVRRPLSRASDRVLADVEALRSYIAEGEFEGEDE
ncbi:MAG TPA: DEAD/DEAH box helicase, partial [Terrimicrobiaceae bacterium]|nr:DEAD/DEAH box helicase [Terrimicrobiaceae bacterium]